jgi:hypothetical protein
MSSFVTSTASDPFLDWIVGRTSMTAAATRYLSAWDGDPQGGGTEVTSDILGTSDRVAMTSAFGTAANDGSITSDASITYTSNASSQADVTYFGLHSAQTGIGNLMAVSDVIAPRLAVIAGDSVAIPAGYITFRLSSEV